jgi:SAM-dependent methyltransferase
MNNFFFMKIASVSVPVKKIIFLVCNKIWLMDPIRNFVYAWAWSYVRSLPKSSSLLDIGARNSQFAAFCAWRGYSVMAIDKDCRFFAWQGHIRKAWKSSYETRVRDVLQIGPDKKYDCILAIFSLQHAGDADSAGYEQAARLLDANGMFLIVNEYNSNRTEFLHGRDDGTLRRYSPQDVQSRIEKPLVSMGIVIVEKIFANADYKKSTIRWESDHTRSNICFIVARKK